MVSSTVWAQLGVSGIAVAEDKAKGTGAGMAANVSAKTGAASSSDPFFNILRIIYNHCQGIDHAIRILKVKIVWGQAAPLLNRGVQINIRSWIRNIVEGDTDFTDYHGLIWGRWMVTKWKPEVQTTTSVSSSIRKSFKYLGILSANLINLTMFLALRNDLLYVKVNPRGNFWGFVTILGISFLAFFLCSMVVLVLLNRKWSNSSQRVFVAIAITLITSGILYMPYCSGAFLNRLIYFKTRQAALDKFTNERHLAFGFCAENLTRNEYDQVKQSAGLPFIYAAADSISVCYSWDGFLPDYIMWISYSVPVTEKVWEYEIRHGDWSKSQKVTLKGGIKEVHYSEDEF
jgi:hypothetical protein